MIRAKNILGEGVNSTSLIVLSPVNPVLCWIPTGMMMPSLVSLTPTSVSISWSELDSTYVNAAHVPVNGGDLPIFYLVEWSTNNIAWTALNPGGTALIRILSYTHTVATPFGSGITLYYRVRV